MRKLLILTMVLSALLIAVPVIADPGTLYVDDDPGCGGNEPCYSTIQSAIEAANNGDTISIAAGTYYEHVTIKESVTLRGAGAGSTIIDGNGTGRVFSVDGFFTVEIEDVTIQNGSAYNGGGVQNNYGTVALTNCTVSGNSGEWNSGGIENNYGTLTLTNSTVSGNSTVAGGGGMLNWWGTLVLTSSTVSSNSAGNGGGIQNYYGTLALTNCTVSSNSAEFNGGGILNNSEYEPLAEVTLTSSTVSGNSAGLEGSGIYNCPNGTVKLANTIVATQASGENCFGATLPTSLGHNLDSDGTCNLVAPGDIPNTSPLLGPLKLRAPGNTETHILKPGSPAIDAGCDDPGCQSCPATDQRGVPRPVDGDKDGFAICDIGAYERWEQRRIGQD